MKADVVSAAKAQFVLDQDAAVQKFGEACYDGGAADQKAADGSSTSPSDQATIDALNAQVAQLQAQDAQDAADAAQAKSDLAAAQSALSDLQVKFASDEAVIQSLSDAKTKLQSVLDALNALIAPPAPAPVPDPTPAPAPAAG